MRAYPNQLPSLLLTSQSRLHRELKRRQKQREKEARKAETSANQPPAQPNAADDVTNEDDLSPNVRSISVQVISALWSIDGRWRILSFSFLPSRLILYTNDLCFVAIF